METTSLLSYFLDYQSDIKTTAGFHALFVIEPTLTKTQGFKRQLTLNLAQYEEIHTDIPRLGRFPSQTFVL